MDESDESNELEETDEFDVCDGCDESIDCDECDKRKPIGLEGAYGFVREERVPYISAKMQMIRLEDAEKLLKAINRGEDYLDPDFDIDLDLHCDYLPRQRISNVVQELDSLFDASIMAIDLALVKGKEWFGQVIEKTAPIFNNAWKDGVFTLEKNKRFLESVAGIVNLHTSFPDENTGADKPQKESKSTDVEPTDVTAHDTAKRKEILKYALDIQRKHPDIEHDTRIAEIVAGNRKYSLFRSFHFGRWKAETGIDFRTEAEALRKDFRKGRVLPTSQAVASKVNAEAEMNEIYEMFRYEQKLPEMTIEEFKEMYPPGSYMNDEFLAFYEKKTDCELSGHQQLKEDMDKDDSFDD